MTGCLRLAFAWDLRNAKRKHGRVPIIGVSLMRKTLVIALREYLAAVRTKTFIISLIIIPVMMLGSIILQVLLTGVVDQSDKHFVVLDRGAPADLLKDIKEKNKEHNKQMPRFVIDDFVRAKSGDALNEQRFGLSEEVRAGKIVGFVEITPTEALPAKKEKSKDKSNVQIFLRYQTNRPTYMDFANFVKKVVEENVRNKLQAQAKLSAAQAQALILPVTLDSKGLSHKDAVSGKIEDASTQGQFAPVIVPAVMMMLMFMVVMMTATPFMQSVVEEKMQRIAEVLLGSVRPFELMMGKLVGMVCVSLTIAAVYLGGAYWAAQRYGFAEFISPELLIWFVILQSLAGMMYGSLFIAIGAACTDMKETQNLLLPVMLLVCLPLFFLGNIMREPNSAIARGLSFFPFSTPMLMIARIAAPPGLPWWEPTLGVLLVLATTVLCVWAGGRIFRVGILMQGKGAKIGQMVKWIIRG
jgi:ABC-2 type transport system permease protein